MSIKQITAAMTADDGFEQARQAGFTGEHNASELVITLNEEFAGEQWDFLALIFNTCAPGGCFSSNAVRDENSAPVYREGNSLICPLGENLTSTGVLLVQAAAYKTSGAHCSAVRKSDILTLTFKPSVMGSGGFLSSNAGFENEVRCAVEAFNTYSESFDDIHTHGNMTVLEGLGETEGSLTFNGEKVGGVYVLPTASLTQKGGVKPGFGVEMTGEYLGISDSFLTLCAAYSACRSSADNSILYVFSGSPAEYDYIDGSTPGITQYLYEMDDTRSKIYYIPTQDGILEWLDFFGTAHTLSVQGGTIYLFAYDDSTSEISVSRREPGEV